MNTTFGEKNVMTASKISSLDQSELRLTFLTVQTNQNWFRERQPVSHPSGQDNQKKNVQQYFIIPLEIPGFTCLIHSFTDKRIFYVPNPFP
jgi:hypothetical protein